MFRLLSATISDCGFGKESIMSKKDESKKQNPIDKKALEKRTKDFALEVIKIVTNLPKTKLGEVFEDQILRSATSIGANYHLALTPESLFCIRLT